MYLYLRIDDADVFSRVVKRCDQSSIKLVEEGLYLHGDRVDQNVYQISWHDEKSIDADGAKLEGNGVLLRCIFGSDESGRGGVLAAQNFDRVLSDLDPTEKENVDFAINGVACDSGHIKGILKVSARSRTAQFCVAKASAMSGNASMLANYFESFSQCAKSYRDSGAKDGEDVGYTFPAKPVKPLIWGLPTRLGIVLLHDQIKYKVFDTVIAHGMSHLSVDAMHFVLYARSVVCPASKVYTYKDADTMAINGGFYDSEFKEFRPLRKTGRSHPESGDTSLKNNNICYAVNATIGGAKLVTDGVVSKEIRSSDWLRSSGEVCAFQRAGTNMSGVSVASCNNSKCTRQCLADTW